ncbi:MAG: signal peptidase I [Clostridia bacterium]|nr:signal peptidase I [Clostridia bacterium]
MSVKKNILKEILGWVLAFLIPIIIVFTLNMKVFAISTIDQSSMHNTFFEGDVVYFNRFDDKLSSLKREDIILFLTNGREKHGLMDEVGIKLTDFTDKFRVKSERINERYVKRIIGMPGDVIDIKEDGSVTINGVRENKAYVVGKSPRGTISYPVTVPADHLFVLGDNREISKDSRYFGCISIKSVEGKATFVLWPPAKVGPVK